METLEGYYTTFDKLEPKIKITGSQEYTTKQTKSTDNKILTAIEFFKKAARQLPVQPSANPVNEITHDVINGNKDQHIQPIATNGSTEKEFNPNNKRKIETVKNSSIIKPTPETISENPPEITNEEIDTPHSTGIDSANIASHDDREISLALRSESDESNNSQQDNNTKVLENDANRESLSEEFNEHPKNLTNNGLSTDLDSTLNSQTDVNILSTGSNKESLINSSSSSDENPDLIHPPSTKTIYSPIIKQPEDSTDESNKLPKPDQNGDLTNHIVENTDPQIRIEQNPLNDGSNLRHHNHLDIDSQSNPQKHKIPEQITSVGSVHIENHNQPEEFIKTLSTKGPPNQLFTKIDSGDKVTYVTSENIIYIYDKILNTTNEYQKSINNLEKMRKVRIENGVLQIMFDGKFESVTEPDLDKYYEHVKKPEERTKTFFKDMMDASLAVLNDIGGVIP